MTEQVDIAVDLGAVPQALPEIVTLREFAAPVVPSQIIQCISSTGELHENG